MTSCTFPMMALNQWATSPSSSVLLTCNRLVRSPSPSAMSFSISTVWRSGWLMPRLITYARPRPRASPAQTRTVRTVVARLAVARASPCPCSATLRCRSISFVSALTEPAPNGVGPAARHAAASSILPAPTSSNHFGRELKYFCETSFHSLIASRSSGVRSPVS